jgi:hypothetical protein
MQTKWIALSLTLWGVLITAGSALAPVVGIDITPEGWAEVNESGASLLNALGVVVGSALTIWGRFRAASKVTLFPGGGDA